MQHLFEPPHARPKEHIVAEAFLNRKIDDRHQWNDGVEGHQYHDRQHEYPGFMIEGLVHSAFLGDHPPLFIDLCVRWIEMDMCRGSRDLRTFRNQQLDCMTRMLRLDDAETSSIRNFDHIDWKSRGGEAHEFGPDTKLQMLIPRLACLPLF